MIVQTPELDLWLTYYVDGNGAGFCVIVNQDANVEQWETDGYRCVAAYQLDTSDATDAGHLPINTKLSPGVIREEVQP